MQGEGWEKQSTLRTFLKPTVRTTRDVNVREAELRISHSLALMPPIAAATPVCWICTFSTLVYSILPQLHPTISSKLALSATFLMYRYLKLQLAVGKIARASA